MSESKTTFTEKPIAYAIRNDQGYWIGIWNRRDAAEKVLKRSQAMQLHAEYIVELYGRIEDGTPEI